MTFRPTHDVGPRTQCISGLNYVGLRAPCERFAPWVAPGPRITRFRLAAVLGRMGLDTHRVSNKVSKITSRHLVPLDRAFPAHTLEHLTAAYAAFANQGVVPQPAYIRRVERADGTLLFSGPGAPTSSAQRAVEPTTAFLVASLPAGCGPTPAPGPGPTRGIRRTGWREDRHDRRLQGRLVRGVHPGTRRGRVDRIRPAAHDHR